MAERRALCRIPSTSVESFPSKVSNFNVQHKCAHRDVCPDVGIHESILISARLDKVHFAIFQKFLLYGGEKKFK